MTSLLPTAVRCIDLDTPAHHFAPHLDLAEPSVSKSSPSTIGRVLVAGGMTHKLGRTPLELTTGQAGVLRVTRRYNTGKGRTARQETASAEYEVVVDPAGMLLVDLDAGQPWRFAVQGLRLSDAAQAAVDAEKAEQVRREEERAEAAAAKRRAVAQRFAVVRVAGEVRSIEELFQRAAAEGVDIEVEGEGMETGRLIDRRDGRGVVLSARGFSFPLSELTSG